MCIRIWNKTADMPPTARSNQVCDLQLVNPNLEADSHGEGSA